MDGFRSKKKSDMQNVAFGERWFLRNQKKLLWLLNNYFTKRWFRHALRIHRDDCPLEEQIVEIGPNRFVMKERTMFQDGKMVCERTADFRTHSKYAKRIYLAFWPFWWMMHVWDSLIADRFIPRLSFGFDTLTVRPNANVESVSVDGRVQNFGVVWSTTHDAADGSSAQDSSANDYFTESYFSTPTYTINRAFFLFDTSALTASANISAAVFSLSGDGTAEENADSLTLYVVTTTPASNTAIGTADFDQVGAVDQGNMAASSWNETDGTYNDITLNSTGRGNISKTSITKFGTRDSADLNNSAPTGANRVNCYFADQAGTTKDPKLVITYSTGIDISVVDNINVSESTTADEIREISVVDSITVAETTTLDNQLNPSVVDNVTITDVTTVTNDLGDVSVFDSITVSESTTPQMDLGDISVVDNVTVSETVALEFTFDISVFDSVEVSESTTSSMDLGDISVFDSITVAEFNDFFFDLYLLSVFDSVTVAEATTPSIDLGDISVFDSVTIVDVVNIDIGLDITVSDNVAVSDPVNMTLMIGISVFDSITIAEFIPSGQVSSRRDGWTVMLRSTQQAYPIPLDSSGPIGQDSRQQAYPIPLDDTDIL